jgi:hypothetical protein
MGMITRRRSGFLRHPFPMVGWRFPDPGDPGGKCDVIGVISSTAWYAAVRGLPRCRGLSNRILVHHSTLSQSRRGSSMSLAKCILSQNVRRVRVCKRHLLPARDRKAPERMRCHFHGGCFGMGLFKIGLILIDTRSFISRHRFGSCIRLPRSHRTARGPRRP